MPSSTEETTGICDSLQSYESCVTLETTKILGNLKDTKGSIQTRVSRGLFSYRITPQSMTVVSPAELQLGEPNLIYSG